MKPRRNKSYILVSMFAGFLSACVSSNSGNGVQSVLEVANQSSQQTSFEPNAYAPVDVASPKGNQVFAAARPELISPPVRPSKTYLINGLGSSVKSIGYGFTNLSKKIPNSQLYNYASFIESSTVIRAQVIKDMKAEYKSDPSIELNLIGISYGANIVTAIAANMNRSNIPVNYLVTVDGPAMRPIRSNVAKVDNFTCSKGCFGTKSKLASANMRTQYESFKYPTSHIKLANHEAVHARILTQLNPPPPTEQFLVSAE